MRDRCASSTPSFATRSPRGCRPVYATYSTRAAELAAKHAGPDAVAVHLLATEPRGRSWVVDQLAAAAPRPRPGRARSGGTRSNARLPSLRPTSSTRSSCSILPAPRASWAPARGRALPAGARARDRSETRAQALLELTWAAGPAVDISAVTAQLERAIAEVDGDLVLQLEAARRSVNQLSVWRLSESWAAGELQRWAQLQGRTTGERLLLAQLAIGQMHVGGPADLCAEVAERAVGEHGFEAVAGGGMALMFAIIVLFKSDRLDAVDRVLGARVARRPPSRVALRLRTRL